MSKVVVPIELKVDNLDFTNLNTKALESDISGTLGKLSQSVGKISKSAKNADLNKALTSSLNTVESSMNQAAMSASAFNAKMDAAGKSTTQYAQRVEQLKSSIAVIKELDSMQSGPNWSKYRVTLGGQSKTIEEWRKERERLESELQNINGRPFAQFADDEWQKQIDVYYHKLMQSVSKVNQARKSWTDTKSANKFTESYTEQLQTLKNLEGKFADLQAKAHRFAATGQASDQQWKNLYYDVTLLARAMAEAEAKARKLVDSNKAFRFNEDKTSAQRFGQHSSISGYANRSQKSIDSIASNTPAVKSDEYKQLSAQMTQVAAKFAAVQQKAQQLAATGNTSVSAWSQVDAKINALSTEFNTAYQRATELVNTGKAFTLGASSNAVSGEMNSLVQQMAAFTTNLVSTTNNIPAVFSAQYSQLSGELDSALQKLTALEQKALMMQATNSGTASTWYSMGVQADTLNAKCSEILSTMRNLVNTGKAFQFGSSNNVAAAESAELQKLAQLSGQVSSKFGEVKQASDSKTMSLQSEAEAEQRDAASMENLSSSGIKLSSILRAVGKVAKTIGHALLSAFRTGVRACGNLIKSLRSAVRWLLKFRRSGRGSTDDLSTSLKHGLRFLTKYIFGFRSMFFLVRKIRAAFKTGMNTLATQFSEVNAELTELERNFRQLKASLTTAFQPIARVVIPILNQLMQALVRVMNIIGQFFAALTGQGYIYKATAAATDYADSVSGVGNAASEAEKKLADYDKLLVIDQGNNSGGGSGSGGNSDIFDNVTYDKQDVSQKIKDFVAAIKEAWQNQDWDFFKDLGTTVAQKIADGLNSIDWTGIQNTCKNIAAAIASFLTGFLGNKQLWNALGTTLASAINTVIYSLQSFIDYFDFKSVASAIVSGITTAIETIDWEALGTAVSDLITGALGFLITAAQEFPWETLGEKIRTALSQIKWKEIIQNIGTLIHSVITGLYSFLQGLLGGDVNEVLSAISTKIRNYNWIELGSKLGSYLITFIQDYVPWNTISAIIGALFKTALGFILGAVRTFNWAEAGAALGRKFQEICKDEELWSTLGQLLNDGLIGALEALHSFLTEQEPGELTEALTTMFAEVDWDSVFSLLGTCLGQIGAWLGGEILYSFAQFFERVGFFSEGTAERFRNWYDEAYDITWNSKRDAKSASESISESAAGLALGIKRSAGTANAATESIGTTAASTATSFAGSVKNITSKAGQTETAVTNSFNKTAAGITSSVKTSNKDATTYSNKTSTTLKSNYNSAHLGVSTSMLGIKNAVQNNLKSANTDTTTQLTNFSTTTSSKFGTAATSTKSSMKNLHTFVTDALSNVNRDQQTKLTEFNKNVSDKMSVTKTTTSDKMRTIKSTISDSFRDASTLANNGMQTLNTNTTTKFNSVYNTISGTMSRIKGLFNVSWSLPHIKLPHFSISPSGWKASDLLSGTIPKLGISWYAKGGIVDGASLIGAGESGAEAIVPLERHTEWITKVAEKLAEVLSDFAVFDKVCDALDDISIRLQAIPSAISTLRNLQISIPAVATGSVLPASEAFLSKLNHIDSQLTAIHATIRDMAQYTTRGSNNSTIVLQLDKKTVAQAVWSETTKRYKQTGKYPF